jgi:hypothetical protein
MKANAKEYKYPLRLPREEEPQIAALAKESGQSTNSILILCIRKGLPLVREALCQNSGRVTTVDPLPERVLRRIYGKKDELDRVTAEQLTKFQSQTEPE